MKGRHLIKAVRYSRAHRKPKNQVSDALLDCNMRIRRFKLPKSAYTRKERTCNLNKRLIELKLSISEEAQPMSLLVGK
jgi:hypothetical protein